MATSRPSSASKTSHSRAGTSHKTAHSSGNGHTDPQTHAAPPDWVTDPMGGTRQTLDALMQLHQQWLESASMGGETLAQEIKELQQAKDPAQFISAQLAIVNQQLELCTRQVAALLQQVYDAQLLWLGQWDSKADEARSAADHSRSAFSALGRMQDEWLKVTQNWIDSVNGASNSR